MPRYVKILLSALLCLAIGGLSGFATTDAITGWYANIQKPSFNPPNWIFGPVWTVLYIMMGVALGSIWSETTKLSKSKAYTFFFVQLVLNGIWSIIFFAMENPPLAMVDILLLLIFIVLTIKAFLPINKAAAYLLIPYLLWVSFASVLNASIWYLNA